MRGMRGRARLIAAVLALAALRPVRGHIRRARRSRYVLPRLPGGQRVEHGYLQAAGSEENKAGSGPCMPALRCCIPTSVRRTTGSRSTWWTAHPDRARRLRVRRRERSRSVSVRARHPCGGRLRPAREHDRSGHMHALRAVRRGVERRRADGRERCDLPSAGAEREQPAAGELDAARRRGPPDLPGARPVGRGRRRRRIEHAIRFTVNCTSRQLRVAGASPGRRSATAVRRWAPGSA